MTKDEMIEWFESAPEGSRHHRMVWTAPKIARLTGATEGGAYQMLLGLLIEADETAAGLKGAHHPTAGRAGSDEKLDGLGFDEQIFGADKQVPGRGQSD